MLMEAMRILKATYPNPRRTIIAGHWGGEGQGLKLRGPEDGRPHQRLSKALEALGRARGLSGQLLTFTSSGAPVTTPVDIGPLLEEGARFSLAGSNVTMSRGERATRRADPLRTNTITSRVDIGSPRKESRSESDKPLKTLPAISTCE